MPGESWTTEDEVRFIQNIGTFRSESRRGNHTRLELLEGYLNGLAQRVNWGKIDKTIATNTALMEISKEL